MGWGGHYLHENNAEEETSEHLAEQHKERGLGGWQPAEHEAQVPAVVQAQAQQLLPAAPARHLAPAHTFCEPHSRQHMNALQSQFGTNDC